MNTPGVEYRDVPGFPFYRAGSDGSVWGCRRGMGARRGWRRLKGSPHGKQDRVMVKLYRGSEYRWVFVHTVILWTFVGPQPDGLECCHGDGNPHNNAVSNLRWDTHVANMADRRRHGRELSGERSPRAKLTEQEAREIHRRCSAGERQRDVAKAFRIGKSTVGFIMTGDRWKHLNLAAA